MSNLTKKHDQLSVNRSQNQSHDLPSLASGNPLDKRFGLPKIILIGVCAVYGCTLENYGNNSESKDKISTQQQEDKDSKPVHKEVGEASWYGPGFQGKETANGETFDQKEMTAAHPSLPLGSKAKVTNLENGKKVEVRINDRGPYSNDRFIDVSRAAAKKLDMKGDGSAQVKIETKPVK